jgi:hypothetical protein
MIDDEQEKDLNVELLTYNDVINKINNGENHLLIGNGFNYGLGVNTGYKAIFNEMIKSRHALYKDAEDIVESCGYDLEKFIGELQKDINDENEFLKKFISNKVKLDFLQATHKIVKSSIKNVYAEKNEGIYILLNNFSNFFTLNYDSFLYILLLKYKRSVSQKNIDVEGSLAMTPNLKFIEEDMNDKQENIYAEIKRLRENGQLTITKDSNDKTTSDLDKITKTDFLSAVKIYNKKKSKGWEVKDIERVIKLIYEEEKKNNIIENLDDGSRQISLFDYHFENPSTQNLFFLHGAFHIIEEDGKTKKIIQKQDKALYEKLEEILNSEEKEIITIFQSTGKGKVINQNKYLKHGLNKLKTLSGSMVIIGSSLDSNDTHIFREINNSDIEKIYISVISNLKNKYYEKAKQLFPSKQIYMFEAESISYELPSAETVE